MLILAGALLVSFIFPIALYLFLRSAHKGDEEYKKDCSRLLLHGLLLGFPVFGFSLLCNIVFRITHISDAFPFASIMKRASSSFLLSKHLVTSPWRRVTSTGSSSAGMSGSNSCSFIRLFF